MLKRVIAWIMLAGFLFIVANILFIGWHREASAYVYLVVAISFFLYGIYKNRTGRVVDKRENGTGNDENNPEG